MKINASGNTFTVGATPAVSHDLKDTSTQPKYRLCLNGFTLVSGGKVWMMEKA